MNESELRLEIRFTTSCTTNIFIHGSILEERDYLIDLTDSSVQESLSLSRVIDSS